MTPPKLIIFDCDGVLVDSEVISNRVLAANLTAHGLPMTPERAMTLFIGGTMASVGDAARDLGADLGPDWLDEIYGLIYAVLAKGTPLVDGVLQVLDRLDAAGVPYCVGSNGSEEKMQITLGQNGLLPRFDGAIFSAHTLKVAKPDPCLLLAAAKAFGVAPADSAVIEDSATGIRAAAAAGMRCFGYAPEGGGAALADLGAVVFTAMADLPALLSLPIR